MKLVVFDVDGTLVDSQEHIVAAMTRAFAAVDLVLPSRADLLSIVGLSLPQAMERLAPQAAASLHEAMVTAYKAAYNGIDVRHNSPLYPGARKVLEQLHGRDDLLLGIATGKSRRGLTGLLAAHGLTGYFVTTQVADDHPSKPHPAMLLAAVAQAGVAPEDAVIIGDTSFDMDMGRAAGTRRLGVSWGYHPIAALTAAEGLIDRFDDVPQALAGLWGQA